MKIDNADRWFSRFIRLRDADENGICTCITCGIKRHWKQIDSGHWIKRQHQATRFNEYNCHAQCKRCNGFEQGRDSEFEKYIIQTYGQKIRDLLKSGERQSCHRSKLEKEFLAKEYQERAIKIAKNKGLTI